MTQSEELKAVKCRCGHKKTITCVGYKSFNIECEKIDCWKGPDRKTEPEAIKAWNEVMEVK
jgi:hypothetical protein